MVEPRHGTVEGTPSRRQRLVATLSHYRVLTPDILWSSASYLLVVLVRFGSFVMLGRELGPTHYGAYVGMYGLLNPIGSLTFAGLRLAVLQRAMYEKHDLSAVTNHYVTIALGQGVIGLVIALLLAVAFIDQLSLPIVAMYGIIELLLLATVEVASAVVHVSSAFAAATRVRIATQLVRTGTLAVLFFADSLTLATLGIALTGSSAVFTAYILVIRLRREGIKVRLSRPHARDLIVGSQLTLTLFASSLKEDADKAVLAGSGMTRAAGIYGAGYRVMQFGTVPIGSIENALFHRFLVDGETGAEHQMRRALRYTAVVLGISTGLALGLFAVAAHLDRVLGQSFDEARHVVRWLSPVIPLIALAQGPSNGLAGLGRLALRGTVVGAGAVISLVLYMVLIPALGWRGAALGTIVSEAFTSLALWAAFVVAYRQAQAAKNALE